MKMYIQLLLITSCISTSILCTTQHPQPSQNSDNQPTLSSQEEATMSKVRRSSFKRPDKQKRRNYTPEREEQQNVFARLFHLKQKNKAH